LPLTDTALDSAWLEYLLTAVTNTGERLTPYSPLFESTHDCFVAGWVARDAEVQALRDDLARALNSAALPAPVEAEAEVVILEPVFEPAAVPAHEFDVVSRTLRAAADEARDIERIGQTPYASIAVSEAERFNDHPLSGLYRSDDNRAFIGWLDQAAENALIGVLPETYVPSK